jgi:uncharacterized membrane protein
MPRFPNSALHEECIDYAPILSLAMNTRDAINAGVLLAVAAAMIGAVSMSVRHNGQGPIERERCYGITKAGQNDCANAVHSCAKRANVDHDQREWIAVPKGTCQRLAGAVMDERGP